MVDWEDQHALNVRFIERDKDRFYSKKLAEQAWSMAKNAFTLVQGWIAYIAVKEMGAGDWSVAIGIIWFLFAGYQIDKAKPKGPGN